LKENVPFISRNNVSFRHVLPNLPYFLNTIYYINI